MQKIKSVAGPNKYTTGGFTITFGEMEKVNQVAVVSSSEDESATNDLAAALVVSIATNVVTIVIMNLNTAGGGKAWAQMANNTYNLAAVTFTAIADGE